MTFGQKIRNNSNFDHLGICDSRFFWFSQKNEALNGILGITLPYDQFIIYILATLCTISWPYQQNCGAHSGLKRLLRQRFSDKFGSLTLKEVL